jgi:hypothetical protein
MRQAAMAGLALLAVWSGVSFVRETYSAWTQVASREVLNIRLPGRWLPRARQVAELQGFLAEVDATVPADEAIAFYADAPEAQRLYVYLWASYLLPERDLLPLSQSDWRQRTAFVAIYGAAPADGDLELVEQFEQGALLRRKP